MWELFVSVLSHQGAVSTIVPVNHSQSGLASCPWHEDLLQGHARDAQGC